MASVCRICRRTGKRGLVPLSRSCSPEQKPALDMLIAVAGPGIKNEETYDRVPEAVCPGCIRRLQLAYSFRLLCRRSLRTLLLNPPGETSLSCALCCAPNCEKVLMAIDDARGRRRLTISDMVENLVDVELIRDRSQKYACKGCCNQVVSVYKFKMTCLESEEHWLANAFFPWEKMEIDGDDPNHLVVDLFAEVVHDGAGKAHCSICLLEVEMNQIGTECNGCLLVLRDNAKPQTNGVPSISSSTHEEDSVDCGLEISCDEEEDNSQTLDSFDEGRNEHPFSETEPQPVSKPADERLEAVPQEVSKPAKKAAGSVEEIERVFSIIEAYPNDPFPVLQRKGPWCSKCVKFFANKSEMELHQAKRHPASSCSGTLPCNYCERQRSSQGLERHRRAMDTFVFDFCKGCEIVFDSPKLFRQHKFRAHMNCEVVKEAEALFDTEIVVHYECCVPRCYNRYSTEENLHKHLKVAHKLLEEQSAQKNTCQYCKVSFHTKVSMQQHWRAEKNLYKCRVDGCNYTRLNVNCMLLHCSQKPHSKYVHKRIMEVKILTPDLNDFTVIGEMDKNTDILQRHLQLCCKCLLFFKTKKELAEHCKLHRVEAGYHLFQCETCGKVCNTKSAYMHHRKLQESLTHYYCRTCKEFLWRRTDYLNHIVTNHLHEDDLSGQYETIEDHSFTCCGCWQVFETEKKLVVHRRTFHPPSTRIPRNPKCDYCLKYKESSEELEQHIASYESKVAYRCKVTGCFMRTKNLNDMKKHILVGVHKKVSGKRVKKEEPAVHRCCVDSCDFRCVYYSALIEHGKEEHADKRKQFSSDRTTFQYRCLVCCKAFTRSFLLDLHKRGKQHQRCDGCKQHFERTAYLTHAQTCSKLLRYRHSHQKKPSENTLKTHLPKVHPTNEPRRVCSICGKLRTDMKAHMQLHAKQGVTNKKQIFKCSTCGVRFNLRSLLRIHKRAHSHNTIRKFLCRHGCGKHYKRCSDRDNHEQSAHRKIKPSVSEVSNESFDQEHNLRLQQKHDVEMVYQCSYCSACFEEEAEYEDHCLSCVESIEQIF